ncbi:MULTISPECIES: ATP-binding cassette domain-containing protein [unclassified Chelatococcus]|uniref:ATP-binding cassette domain-containing protein n=1 Tax=unclassified Chelatococcus TaxID=2638111 RepID=UPI001BD17B67|nr:MULTISPECIES: ATP-binding cassette domain-containing protein [unclassified Chelatococcus]CAH1663183.1 Ni(2(+)) ABC transporter ATP binding subunit NikD [Hyphomicrobiales bacterium]MBS7741539.1 ATP-binding cassette domain-containing protein [Chelatococcus sp. HY11]MBX3544442.1 ATP-binding cassette domain-containing protein [Chelatococcus sp.]MCO5079035.1 ATP-binding cassette domain-containing protein [Chelatococcus sp.]CAH1682355.1 Ni(2(+)) ABC transporter ATP binding subunit NikD [Hyphomicr
MPTLTIEDLTITTHRHGREIALVDGLTLTLEAGRILALVGPSGSGKSLTASGAQGVLPAGVSRRIGRILLDGEEKPAATLRGRTIATIMQNPRSAFNPVKTMRAHAVETLAAVGHRDAGSEDAIRDTMAEVGLDDPARILALHPFEMSGGMLQRMMIALALLSRAPFLFADEPTTDIDLVVQARLLDLIERVARERQLGVLLITHDMGVVARLADDMAVMSAGRIVERGSVRAIFDAPAHPVTQSLIAAHLALYVDEEVA